MKLFTTEMRFFLRTCKTQTYTDRYRETHAHTQVFAHRDRQKDMHKGVILLLPVTVTCPIPDPLCIVQYNSTILLIWSQHTQ